MIQPMNILIGAIGLLLGFPLGNYLAKLTKEELRPGQKAYQNPLW